MSGEKHWFIMCYIQITIMFDLVFLISGAKVQQKINLTNKNT